MRLHRYRRAGPRCRFSGRGPWRTCRGAACGGYCAHDDERCHVYRTGGLGASVRHEQARARSARGGLAPGAWSTSRPRNAAAAVAAGWASYRPEANRALRLATPQAPHNGWEERHLYSYETSPNEKARDLCAAWRAGKNWTVAIVEATSATFEKRNAAFSLVIGSLRPKGYQRELFTAKQADRLDAARIARSKISSGMSCGSSTSRRGLESHRSRPGCFSGRSRRESAGQAGTRWMPIRSSWPPPT